MTLRRFIPQALLGFLLALSAIATMAQTDPPGRVGRLANIAGSVMVFDQEQGAWTPALPNRPITSGDRVSTGPDARAEVRTGSTVLRLSARTELEATRIDDSALQFQLHSGSVALRLRTRAAVDELSFRTAEARFKPMRTGHYRFDRQDDTSFAGTLSGELLVDESESFPIGAGQRMELWRARGQAQLQYRWSALPGDAFMAWATAEDQRDDRTASNRYVSPEMTGAEDLDRYGRWDRHPEYGAVWSPLNLQVGWEPYRHGRWVAIRPWGWTWVDDQPWGFAPFHYGRWLQWRGVWCWAPGVYVARPVFAPALVTWIGGPQLGLSLSFGGALPASRWAPLPPRDVYQPHYVASPRHVELVNEHGWHGGRQWRDDRRERPTQPEPNFRSERPERLERPERPERHTRPEPQRPGVGFGPAPTPANPALAAPQLPRHSPPMIAQPTPPPRPMATQPGTPPQASGAWQGARVPVPVPVQPPAGMVESKPERHGGKPGQGSPAHGDTARVHGQEDGRMRAPELRPGQRDREPREQNR